MASKDMALAALRTLHKHGELVIDAHLMHRGLIPDNPEWDTAIGALRKHRLIWTDPDEDLIQLHSTVSRLLENSLLTYRRHAANDEIAGIWDYLQNHLLPQYATAKRKVSRPDIARLAREIQESVTEMIQLLDQATWRFSQYIYNGFAYIEDMELRIRENEMVIGSASRLNDMLGTFSGSEFYRIPGADPLLRRLFTRQLSTALARGHKELTNALHQLRELQYRLRANQEQSRLIHAFDTAYANNPGFMPEIETLSLSALPVVLKRAQPLNLEAFAPLRDSTQEQELARSVQGVHLVKTGPPPVDTVRYPLDAGEFVPLTVLPDMLVEAAQELIALALEAGQPLSAAEAYHVLDIEEPGELWLFCLINSVWALPVEQRRRLKMEFDEIQDRMFPDNYHIKDVVLSSRR